MGNVHPLWFSVLLTLIFTAGHSFEKSGKKLQTSFVQGYFMSHVNTKNRQTRFTKTAWKLLWYKESHFEDNGWCYTEEY